jgi:hypothetical protein
LAIERFTLVVAGGAAESPYEMSFGYTILESPMGAESYYPKQLYSPMRSVSLRRPAGRLTTSRGVPSLLVSKCGTPSPDEIADHGRDSGLFGQGIAWYCSYLFQFGTRRREALDCSGPCSRSRARRGGRGFFALRWPLAAIHDGEVLPGSTKPTGHPRSMRRCAAGATALAMPQALIGSSGVIG